MNEIDVSKCKGCSFYEEFGAMCNMYSCHETNYSITEWQDKCLYKQLQQLKQKLEKIKDFIKYCTNVNHKGCSIKCKYIDDCESSIEYILQIIEEE